MDEGYAPNKDTTSFSTEVKVPKIAPIFTALSPTVLAVLSDAVSAEMLAP